MPQVTSSIVIDQISTGAISGTGTVTVEHSVSSQDAVLVVCIADSAGTNSRGVLVVGGETISTTNSVAGSNSTNSQAQIYYIARPPVGNITISYTNASATFGIIFKAITLLGVKRTLVDGTLKTASATNNDGTPVLSITPHVANSIIIDCVMAANHSISCNANQTQIGNDTDANADFAGVSYKFVQNNFITTMSWTLLGGTDFWGYCAIVLEPANANSTWFPSVGERNMLDVTNAKGLDAVAGTALNYQKYGFKPSTFYKNSFLHTLGRTAGSLQSGPYGIGSAKLIKSNIIIDNITQLVKNNVGAGGFTVNHNITSQGVVAVVMVMNSSNASSTLQINGQLFLSTILRQTDSTNTATLEIYYITNLPVGISNFNFIPSATGQNWHTCIISLLGVDISQNKPDFVFAKTGEQTSTLNVPSYFPDSIVIDAFINNSGTVGTSIKVANSDNEGQFQIMNSAAPAANAAQAGVSFSYGGGSSFNIGWTIVGATLKRWVHGAIILNPARTSSLFNPNIKLRNSRDASAGLDNSNTIALSFRSSGYFPSTFWKNSFLHTVGRVINGVPIVAPPESTTQVWRNLLGVGY